MKIKSLKKFHLHAVFAGILLLSACAANQPADSAIRTPQSQVALNTCGTGSFAAIMSAKLPPNARPGNPEIYKDCH